MYSPAQLVRMAWGKVRRFVMPVVSPQTLSESLAKREGHCTRCGACCKLLFRCPWLAEEDGLYTCTIHGKKPGNCVRFPIDARDLADRDIVMPEVRCGYSFPEEASVVPLARGS